MRAAKAPTTFHTSGSGSVALRSTPNEAVPRQRSHCRPCTVGMNCGIPCNVALGPTVPRALGRRRTHREHERIPSNVPRCHVRSIRPSPGSVQGVRWRFATSQCSAVGQGPVPLVRQSACSYGPPLRIVGQSQAGTRPPGRHRVEPLRYPPAMRTAAAGDCTTEDT